MLKYNQTEAKRRAALLNDVDMDKFSYGVVKGLGGGTPLSRPLLVQDSGEATQQRLSLASGNRHYFKNLDEAQPSITALFHSCAHNHQNFTNS